MIIYIVNKDHIRQMCVCMHALRNKLSFIIFSFSVYFKMAANRGLH